MGPTAPTAVMGRKGRTLTPMWATGRDAETIAGQAWPPCAAALDGPRHPRRQGDASPADLTWSPRRPGREDIPGRQRWRHVHPYVVCSATAATTASERILSRSIRIRAEDNRAAPSNSHKLRPVRAARCMYMYCAIRRPHLKTGPAGRGGQGRGGPRGGLREGRGV